MDSAMNDVNFKILSLNIRGLHKEKKRRSLFKRLKVENIQICFLQETFSTPKVEQRWRNEWGGKMFCVHGTNHARGVMILLKPGMDVDILNIHQDDIGRVLLVEAKIKDTVFKLLNIYSPNCENSQVQFYRFIQKFMKRHMTSNDNILLAGDFNVILNPSLDRKGGNHRETYQYKQIISILHTIKSDFELEDIWRTKHPTTRRFTWRRQHPEPCSSRLDYWFTSSKLSDYVEKTDILPSYYSDHSGVFLHIKGFSSVKAGRGYWKMNNSYLQENVYIQGIVEGIGTWLADAELSSLDARSKWEYIKFKIREFSLSYGKQRSRQRIDQEKELLEKLQKLEEKHDSLTDTDERVKVGDEMDTIKAKLKEIDNYKMEGLILRSRTRWYEKGEKSTAYFLRLESRNKIKKSINKLQKPDGSFTCN